MARRRPNLPLTDRRLSLGEIILGDGPPIDKENDRIMAVPTGIASVDMTIAQAIYDQARQLGMGTEISLV